MAIDLLIGAGPGETSAEINVRPVVRDQEPLHFFAFGTFDQAITIEGSPTTETNEWVTIGTLASNGTTLHTHEPYERVRAKTAANQGGTANVYLVPDA